MNKKFVSYLFFNKLYVGLIFVLMVLASVFALLVPYIQGAIVDNAVLSLNQSALLNFCLGVFAVLILDALCFLEINRVLTKLGFGIAEKVRADIFKSVMYKPFDFFETNKRGDILYRTNTYIYEIGNSLSKDLYNLAFGLAQVIIIFTFLMVLNIRIALILLVLYFVIFVFIYLMAKVIVKKAKRTKRGELERNSLILQNIDGMETFLAYNTRFRNLKNYVKVNSEYGRVRASFYKSLISFAPLVEFFVGFGVVLVYFFAFSFNIGLLELGVVISLLSYTSKITSPMQLFAKGLSSLFEISAQVDEVFEFTGETQSNVKKQLSFERINMRCENLCYENPGSINDINNLSIEIPFGQKILITGKYGLGKTSFAHLLCGLYKSDSGRVLFNEVSIREIEPQSLSKMITITSDYVGVLRASIYDNVKFANPNASNEQVMNAIEMSGLNKVISKLERGAQTLVNQEILSEGDKQLLSFARIILKDTPVVIVDEVVRDMEDTAKKKFLTQLKKFTKDKTLIFINEEPDIDFAFDKIIDFKTLNRKTNSK